ncbi:unnamed protein product, partial [Ectocarpus sp. 12 AP-2014]
GRGRPFRQRVRDLRPRRHPHRQQGQAHPQPVRVCFFPSQLPGSPEVDPHELVLWPAIPRHLRHPGRFRGLFRGQQVVPRLGALHAVQGR